MKALVQNECTRTLTQRNVNVCRDAHSLKMQMHLCPLYLKHTLNELVIKTLEVYFTDPSCNLCIDD